jgi:hypothetical protein
VLGSEGGGRTAAILYTVVLTCKHLGIDPFAYLREALPGLFTLGEKPSAEELLVWLPDRWLQRRAAESGGREASTG